MSQDQVESKPFDVRETDDPMDYWFGLSYAQFLVLPRVVIQSMPTEWKLKLYDLLHQLEETFEWCPDDTDFRVRVKGDDGKLHKPPDWMCAYRHNNIEHLRKRGPDGRLQEIRGDG